MSKDDKRDPDYQMEIGGKFVLGLVACLITLSALIPTLLGIGLFLVLALLLRRTNPTPYRIGLAAATIASIVTFPLGAVGHYFMWLGGLFGLTEVSPANIPLFALGAYSSFVATLIGAL